MKILLVKGVVEARILVIVAVSAASSASWAALVGILECGVLMGGAVSVRR